MTREEFASKLLSERFSYNGFGGMIGIAKHEFGIKDEFFIEDALDFLLERNLVSSGSEKYDVRITSKGRDVILKYGSLLKMLKKQTKNHKAISFGNSIKSINNGLKRLVESCKFWWQLAVQIFL